MYRDNLYYCLTGFALGMGAGAALMYLLDPESGNRRRSLAKDQLDHARHVTAETLQGTATDLKNRSKGLVHEMENRFTSRESVPATVLEERVRESMGRAVENPSLITVSARKGRVVVSGQVRQDEVDDLLDAVESTGGVRSVDDQLDVREDPEHVPGLKETG